MLLMPAMGGVGRVNVDNVPPGGWEGPLHTLGGTMVAILSPGIWASSRSWDTPSLLMDVQAGLHCGTALAVER